MSGSATVRRLLVALALLLPAPLLQAQAGSVQLHDVEVHYWPGQERLARSLLPPSGFPPFPGLPADILQRGDRVRVYLAPDAARWDSLTGGRAPEWGAGIALPLEGIIILPGYVSARGGTHTLPVIMRHELAHVALQRHIGSIRIPRWFNEGYATWSAGQFDTEAGWMLRLAFTTDRAPPLDSLTLDWPLLAADARMAYLLSASAVTYLYSLSSPATFERFLQHWSDAGSFEQAMRDVYVLATPQFERLWRSHVRRRYGWTQILAQSMFIWTVITMLVILLFVIRRRRDRRRLEQLSGQEEPDRPAYWLGEDEVGDGPGFGEGSPRDGPGDGGDGSPPGPGRPERDEDPRA